MEQACITTTNTSSTAVSSVVTSGNLLSRNSSVDSSLITSINNTPNITSSVSNTISSSISNIPFNTNVGTSLLLDSQKSVTLIPSGTPSPVLSPVGKIIGRNANGTIISTSSPNNDAELQLYRVLQRASLLLYYDTLLEMGGDDVQQLCDAGEEEFLEIMALVGMASKPLHVRRLQKALHEWTTNPSLFKAPLPTSGIVEIANLVYNTPDPSPSKKKLPVSPSFSPTPLINKVVTSTIPKIINLHSSLTSLATGLSSQVTSSSPLLTPVLNEAKISKIAQLAEKMARQLPQKEPKQSSSKKRASKELEQVMIMNENDPRRMDEIRKYAAIYGRFDCKRRPEKPLTLHEVCVNEAAAQICKFIPALLTRRDELFPLARQLVKDAGFGHSASIVRFLEQQQQKLDDNDENSNAKRVRLLSSETSELNKDFLQPGRQNLLEMYQKLTKIPLHLSDILKFSFVRSDYEEDVDNDDSKLSFSTSHSSPVQFGSEADTTIQNNHEEIPLIFLNNEKVTSCPIIISVAGSRIIAVANPALAFSPTLNEITNDALNFNSEATIPDT